MCARFAQHNGPSRYVEWFGAHWIDPVLPNAPARFNAAPTQDLLVLRRNPETGLGAFGLLRWGLVPSWAQDLKFGAKTINARAETVRTSPAFRGAWKAGRRCAVPVDAFYEWRPGSSPKQPYAIARKDGGPLAVAGLWDGWKDPATGTWVRSFTLLTAAANGFMQPLHDRMPVILAREEVAPWLGGEIGYERLGPYPGDDLTAWPVSTRLNAPRNEGADLIEPVAAPAFPGVAPV
ncbi:SOS response-associated peptidase [Aquabacter spiritensis]|uniref:Abasic site processing protein n=1 Tax=Aquabacter spiritensis TaxID=933073 RepID=A0A4R3M010_9HYPH|nr:SOS response-associated peptidase [Aquabacter spiritensis]TCT06043.1 putative SOS response-associated peptidase YedK [Aquabacter spiritensis]